MICFPNAKINLGLHIIEKRGDGFHNIDTVFYPIPLTDILEILPETQTGKTEMVVTGLDIPGDINGNLCLKAYQLLKNDFDIPPIRIILHKRIPMGAGLGGGSSDGAFTLLAINDLFSLQLDNDSLMKYASMLGSDCAFFIVNKPAIGAGRGNELTFIDFSLKGYYLVVVKPSVHVGTAEAYAGVVPHKPEFNANTILLQNIETWKGSLVNHFEKSVFQKHPEIKDIKEKLYNAGAFYASMSGSGAAVYGFFKTEIQISELFGPYFTWGSWI